MKKITNEQIVAIITGDAEHSPLREIAKKAFIKVYRVQVTNILNKTEKLPDIGEECGNFRRLWTEDIDLPDSDFKLYNELLLPIFYSSAGKACEDQGLSE